MLCVTRVGSEPNILFNVRQVMEGEGKRGQPKSGKLRCKVLFSQMQLYFIRQTAQVVSAGIHLVRYEVCKLGVSSGSGHCQSTEL